MQLYCDDEADSSITIERVYKDNQHENNLGKTAKFLFDFYVDLKRAPEPDSDGDEDWDDYQNWETRFVEKTHELDKDLLISGDEALIEDIVCQMLDAVGVPCHRDIVWGLTAEVLNFQKHEAMCVSPEVERIKVWLAVIVRRFPGEHDDDDDDDDHLVDVKLAVAPASNEAVETHLETVVVENDEGYRVICMDTIRTRSDVGAARMPCSHVFHRPCGEKWLRSSAICPVCRAVFPS